MVISKETKINKFPFEYVRVQSDSTRLSQYSVDVLGIECDSLLAYVFYSHSGNNSND